MTKKTPNKYFVGKLSEAKHGSAYRIFRQRKSLFGTIINEIYTDKGWKKMKAGFKKVGIFLKSRAAARDDRRFWQEHSAKQAGQ